MATGILQVGSQFQSMQDLKLALQQFAVENLFEYTIVKADRTRYTIRCKVNHCPWRLHASIIGESQIVMIKTIKDNHACGGIFNHGHCQVSEQYVAKAIQEKIRVNPSYRPKDIREDFFLNHAVKISYSKAFRGKERAVAAVHGTHEEAYALLPQYCEDIAKSNPNTIAIVEHAGEEIEQFTRMFLCYGASAMGFAHCRPLLGLDGTHLTTKYKGNSTECGS